MKFEGETKERLPTVKDLMEVGSVQATFTGQPDDTKVAPTAVSEEDQWSATLGILRPRQSIDLQFRLAGQLKEEVAGKVASALIGDPQFQQMLRAFQAIADGQPSSIQVEAAKNFLQSIAQSEGVLEAALTENAPCISVVKDFSSSFASRFNEEAGNLGVLFNLPQFAKEVRQLNLDGITETSTARQIYELTKNWTDADYKKGAVALAPVVLTIAKRAVSRLQDTYEQVISTVRDDIVLEIAETAQFEETVDTTDLEKYAGFDVGVLYTPRVDELRQYFMIHIYPTGTVELEPGKIRGGRVRNRLSIAVGVSFGDVSSNENSRVKEENAFVYGVGCRLNKYFRVTAGGMVFRSSGATQCSLCNEFFVGPSIDLTALPGLRQIFARGVGN